MPTEWLKLMLAEIARKREEAERAQEETLARQKESAKASQANAARTREHKTNASRGA